MTTTRQRINLLAETCKLPEIASWLGEISLHDMEKWLEAELGSKSALDEFQPHGDIQSKALAPAHILHIVSGNTPHAAFQSLFRGLLLGSHNTIKLPSSGIPEFSHSLKLLPTEFKELVETHRSLDPEHWLRAEAVVAIGSDETIQAIHDQILSHQVFIPHGHKISMGVVTGDYAHAAKLAARDVSIYDQRGCLSLHAIYVEGSSEEFASMLAQEMENFARQNPPTSMTVSESGAIRNLRETTLFRAANESTTHLWQSADNLDWTVVHEHSATLKLSCLNRCVYVKPLPPTIDAATFGRQCKHLSTIAIHPFQMKFARQFTDLGAHRICPMGDSQRPSIFWHHDGFAPLASLVKWMDIG